MAAKRKFNYREVYQFAKEWGRQETLEEFQISDSLLRQIISIGDEILEKKAVPRDAKTLDQYSPRKLMQELAKRGKIFPTTDEEVQDFLATHEPVKVPEKYKSPNWILESVCEELEKELDRWRHEHFYGERDDHFSGEYLERTSQLELARHFAEWQYQKDRREFAKIKAKNRCEGFDFCKEKMVEEAVEGIVEEVSFNNGENHNTIRFSFDEESLHVENRIWFPRCGKDGDRVKLIIVKENKND